MCVISKISIVVLPDEIATLEVAQGTTIGQEIFPNLTSRSVPKREEMIIAKLEPGMSRNARSEWVKCMFIYIKTMSSIR